MRFLLPIGLCLVALVVIIEGKFVVNRWRFQLPRRWYYIAENPMSASEAETYCRDFKSTKHHHELAQVHFQRELEDIIEGVKEVYAKNEANINKKAFWLGGKATKKGAKISLSDITPDGRHCVSLTDRGGGNNFELVKRNCNKQLIPICATQQLRFYLNDNWYHMERLSRNINDATDICEDWFGSPLASVGSEEEVLDIERLAKETCAASSFKMVHRLWLDNRAEGPKRALIPFEEVKNEGDLCILIRTRTDMDFAIMKRFCEERHPFLCGPANRVPEVGPPTTTLAPPPTPAPPPTVIPPGTKHEFVVPGLDREFIAYLVDPEQSVDSQTGAYGYCVGEGMRLAEVRDQNTLDELSAALLALEEQIGGHLGELVTAERASKRLEMSVSPNEVNPSGWACATLMYGDGRFGLYAKKCAQQRGLLCEEIPSC